MKVKIITLFLLLCVVFCGCNGGNTQNPTTEFGATEPNSTQVETCDTKPTDNQEVPTSPEEYPQMEFPLDVFDNPQDVTEPQPVPSETVPVTEPSEMEPIVTEPPADIPGSGIELPEDVFNKK